MKKKIAIFGAGKSGLSAFKLANDLGNDVDLYDEYKNDFKNIFLSKNINLYDTYIFSPGFRKSHHWRRILCNNKMVHSELSFAAKFWKGKIIGVTGTNGKTTITSFLTLLLKKAGSDAYAVGNIGRPLSDLINTKANHRNSIAICEISSFQAELCKYLALDSLIWSNFSEDHLDSYNNINEYFFAKLALVESLKDSAEFIIGSGLLTYRSENFWINKRAKVIKELEDANIYINRGELHQESVFTKFPYLLNFSLISHFAKTNNIPKEILYNTSKEFISNEYRLKKIFDSERINIWQDSKSTNTGSVLGALKEMNRDVFWIGGGKSKNTDLDSLANSLSPKVKKIFLFGSVGPSLSKSIKRLDKNVFLRSSLHDALEICFKELMKESKKMPIDVLFSPGFPSFDQFNSYKERGKFFEKAIFSLLKEYSCL